MEFKDFENDYSKLVGKLVVYTSGKSYAKNKSRYIRKIVKVTKTGFRIYDFEKILFDFTGMQKGLHGRMGMGTISICKLITEDEAKKLSSEWKHNKKIKEMKNQIMEVILNNINNLDEDKIKKIFNIINK